MLNRSLFIILVASLSVGGHSRLQPQTPETKQNVASNTGQARTLLNLANASAVKITNNFQRQLVLEKIGAAQAKAGDLEAAVDTANLASSFAPRVFEAIGEQLGQSNDLSRAETLGGKFKQRSISYILSSMARTQVRNGKIEDALQTVKKISSREIRSYALENIARAQAAKGDYSQARKTLALAKAAHALLNPDELEMFIVTRQLSRGETQQARAMIDSWKSDDKRISALIGAAEELRKQGDKTAAEQWLREGLRQLPAGPSHEFFRYLAIPIEVKLGHKEQAFAAAGALSQNLRAKAYMTVAVACAEEKDVACVDTAIERMTSAAPSGQISNFGLNLMILNVTAALIDNEQLEAASRWLAMVEQQINDAGRIKSRTQLQRVVLLAKKGNLEEARLLALAISPNFTTDVERGEALRITALLQTKTKGQGSSQPWSLALSDIEDRAYALLGIAESLLDTGNVKLTYSPIQLH